MISPEDTVPTSWPENIAITTANTPLPDAPAAWPDEWRVVYDGECFRCSLTDHGSRGDVIVWAQDHYTCQAPAAPPVDEPAPPSTSTPITIPVPEPATANASAGPGV